MNTLDFNQLGLLPYVIALSACLTLALILLIRSYQRSKQKNRELGKINRSHRLLKEQVNKLSANIKMSASHYNQERNSKKKSPL